MNPGTQAERHSQLSAGLILQSVAGASVAGKGYQEVLGMIKAGGRPLSMTFAPGGTVATSPRASRRQVSPQRQAMQIVAKERNTTPVRVQLLFRIFVPASLFSSLYLTLSMRCAGKAVAVLEAMPR